MRAFVILLIIVFQQQLQAQSVPGNPACDIDTASIKIRYSRLSIPRRCFDAVGIDNRRDIVSAGKPFSESCVTYKRRPHQRLNWMAKDSKGHYLFSISFGGYFSGTKLIYVDMTHNDNQSAPRTFWLRPTDQSISPGEALREIKTGKLALRARVL